MAIEHASFPSILRDKSRIFSLLCGHDMPPNPTWLVPGSNRGGGSGGKDPSYGRFCIRIQPFALGPDRPIGGEWRMREVVTLSGLGWSHSSIQASRALRWYDTYQWYLSKCMHHAMYLVCLIRTHKTILRRVSFECCNEWRIQGR